MQFTYNANDIRNVKIAEASDLAVAANSTVNILGQSVRIDMARYIMYYVMVRCTDGTPHNFEVKSALFTKTSGSAYASADAVVKVSNGIRAVSDWVEVRSPFLVVEISNGDATEHTYNVLVYGIR